ncbi:sigma 54-interacting transcriptional regulator [Clostridiaceae bacterium 35-E11]
MEVVSNKWTRLILEQMGIVAATDKHGRYIYVNEKWQEDTEISLEQAVGRYSYELIEGSKAIQALRTQKPVIAEIMIKTKGGKDLPAIITYMPIFDKEELFGCFIFSTFSTMNQACLFSERIESITREFESLKGKLRERSGAKYKVEDIIGEGPAMKRLKDQIYLAGASNSTVLIEGETGTGKELVAHAIHNCSLRDIFPFIKVNCSAIPENLIESEFFGYEEGTFTGAKKGGRRGKFEKAHLGSIFLDEINSMSMSMQPKLLRVLQEREIERLGGSESMAVDARVIATSNVPLKSMVKSNQFRMDLYYRLNIIHIIVPPLRERREDIPLLIDHMLHKLNDQMDTKITGISQDALNYLMSYNWPGNVRELQNVVERAIYSCFGDKLVLKNFIAGESMEEQVATHHVDVKDGERTQSLSEKKDCAERETILLALKACDQNRVKTARMLNISRTALYKKLKKYNIK